jgi:flagellar FliL protein
MAENEAPTTGSPGAVSAKPKMSLVGKLLIAGFMASVILIECAVAYFMIPTPEQVAAVTEANYKRRMMETPDSIAEADGVIAENDEAPEVEVDLGTYSITYQNGASMMRIDLGLAGTIKEKDKEELKFDELFEEKKKRFSQMVNVEVRSAELVDLQDPKLGLIRRRILEKSNALFGQRILQDVLVSQFFMIDQ